MAGSMTDVNHEDGTGTISSKMLYHAGVLGLVALVISLFSQFLPQSFWTGGGTAPAQAFLCCITLLMAVGYLFLIRSRVKGAKWIWILFGFSVFDFIFRLIGYQRLPIAHSFNIFRTVAGFAVFMGLAICNKGGLRIAFGAQVLACFISIWVAVYWEIFFKPIGGPSPYVMMFLRLIGIAGSFFTLFGWMYLLYTARDNRTTDKETTAQVPWPWRVLVAFFPELVLLFFCSGIYDLGLFTIALVAFAFGASWPFGYVGMILGGLAYLVFAILVMRCKRRVTFYRLIGCGLALFIVNAIGLLHLSHRHF